MAPVRGTSPFVHSGAHRVADFARSLSFWYSRGLIHEVRNPWRNFETLNAAGG